MKSIIFNGDCGDMLDALPSPMVLGFADPPDNLGLDYDVYKDKIPAEHYYDWLELLTRKALRVFNTFYLSYYWAHDTELTHRFRNIIKHERPGVKLKKVLWRYTFGQYTDGDFGSGFRYLARFTKGGSKFRLDSVRIPSRRMELGDARAAGPRVPDDVWEFPRIVGNAEERRPWHATQHPEGLMRRIILAHSDPGDVVVDCFGGTGTTLRVARQIERSSLISEISSDYCQRIRAENEGSEITDLPNQLVKMVAFS